MTARTAVKASVAAFCWLAIFAGIALALLDHRRAWIGVTAIFAALLIGVPVLARLRRGQKPDDGWVPMDERPECPYDGCDHGDEPDGGYQ